MRNHFAAARHYRVDLAGSSVTPRQLEDYIEKLVAKQVLPDNPAMLARFLFSVKDVNGFPESVEVVGSHVNDSTMQLDFLTYDSTSFRPLFDLMVNKDDPEVLANDRVKNSLWPISVTIKNLLGMEEIQIVRFDPGNPKPVFLFEGGERRIPLRCKWEYSIPGDHYDIEFLLDNGYTLTFNSFHE